MEFNGTFLATIITFVVFVFLMNKVLYAPVLEIMQAREDFINENYKAAKENDSKTEELTNKKNEKLLEAKNNARSKYLDLLSRFKTQKNDIIAEAQHTASEKIDNSKSELENLSNDVKEGLKSKMTDLANDIVEKVLGYRSEVHNFDNDAVNNVLYK